MPRKTKSKEQRAKSKLRQVKQAEYTSFRVSKRIRQPKAPLEGAFRLFISSVKLLAKNWRLFGGIVVVYLILTIVLVKGFGVASNIGELKTNILELSQGNLSQLTTSIALFGFLMTNANSAPTDVAGAYQAVLLLIVSLVLIWALRHSLSSKKPKLTVRDGFYKGLYPLIPFLLVLLVISLQLIPLVVANFLYGVVIVGGLAATAIEKGLWIVLIILLVLLSIYMVTSSIFALYIVTLPDVRPMQALRSARDLVRHRRWMILRKLLLLPIALFLMAAIIMVPVIMLLPVAAEWLFFVLSMATLAVVHSYVYHLYRELL